MRLESGQLIPICRPRQGPWAMPSAPWGAPGGRGEGRRVSRSVLGSSFSGRVHSWSEALSPVKGDGGLDQGY